ncbi:MAG: asparagine synthetase B [Halobacteriota archaeon]
MSGIAGVLGRDSEEKVARMLTALKHRGHFRSEIFFGHLINGVEYSIGTVSLQQSILGLKRETIEGGLEVCDGCSQGQFAKVTVHNSRYLTLERDIVGIKPLFYGMDANTGIFAFASERKALWEIEVDRIRRVEPGQIIAIGNLKVVEKQRKTHHSSSDTAVIYDETYAVEELTKLLKAAINEHSSRNMGIAFSGGVDSTVLWALLENREDTMLYTTGMAGSHDIKSAVNSARLLNAHIRVVKLTLADIEQLIPHVMRAIESCNPMDVAIALPLHAISDSSRKDGIGLMMAGQGADELFGGYKRHFNAYELSQDALSEMLRKDILNMGKNNLERDNLIAASNTVELKLPYLDLNVVNFAMKIAIQLKIKDDINKYILRKIAARFLPHQIAYRHKKAMQYGSGVSGALNTLARNYFSRDRDRDKRGIIGNYLKAIAEENNIRVAE